MTICFYIHPGSDPETARPAIECALRLSGCNVFVVSSNQWEGCTNYDVERAIEEANQKFPQAIERQVNPQTDYYHKAIRMYYLCMAAVVDRIPSFPLLMFDWDMMCCGSMIEFQQWLHRYPLWFTTALFMVSDKTVLTSYAELSGQHDTYECQMSFQQQFVGTCYPGNHGRLVNTSVPYIDHNIHTHTEVWEPDPTIVHAGLQAKKLHWIDGRPHFKRINGGWMYPAHLIHCWGAYKTKTREIRDTLLG